MKFCYGAILCQNGKATAASLAISETSPCEKPKWGFICQYCNLEVGDYKTILLSSSGQALETSDLLASCHVMACNELELRVCYKCLVCYLAQKDHAFTTASAFEAHIMKHTVLPPILEQPISASSQAAQMDIDRFLRNDIPNPVLQSMLVTKPEAQQTLVSDIESDDHGASDNSVTDEFISPPRTSTNSPSHSQPSRVNESNSPWATCRFPPISQEPTVVDHYAVDVSSDVPELDTSVRRRGWELSGSPVNRDAPVELPVPVTAIPDLKGPLIELPVPGGFDSTPSDELLARASQSQGTTTTAPSFSQMSNGSSFISEAASDNKRNNEWIYQENKQFMAPQGMARSPKVVTSQHVPMNLGPQKRKPVTTQRP